MSHAHRNPPAPSLPMGRFLRNVALWLFPVAALWLLLTPFYNRFLLAAGQNLLHLGESPDVTRLLPYTGGFAMVHRTDFPPARSNVYSFRVTDIHFHLVLLATLFLAVPGVPWRRRLSNLGVALLIAAFFHVALVVLWVEFGYATQMGSWSLEHYSAAARESWGLAKHLMDLPFKLGFPLLLWAAFYLRTLFPTSPRGSKQAASEHHI